MSAPSIRSALVCAAIMAAAACGSGYNTDDPNRDHVLAFTGVSASYNAQLTSYQMAFGGTNPNKPLTLVQITVSGNQDICDDMAAGTAVPNSSRMVLMGYVDGDATGSVPATTWNNTYTALPVEPSQLSICLATFYGFDNQGKLLLSLTMNSGTVSFAQVGDPNDHLLQLSYALVPQVGGPKVTLSNPNIAAPYCIF